MYGKVDMILGPMFQVILKYSLCYLFHEGPFLKIFDYISDNLWKTRYDKN